MATEDQLQELIRNRLFPGDSYFSERFWQNENLIYIPKANKDDGVIPALLLINNKSYKNLLIFYHGNGEGIFGYAKMKDMKDFTQGMKMNVLLVEYPGYSVYKNVLSDETRIKSDVDDVYNFLTNIMKLNSKNIFILGRSIGTGVGIYFASKYDIGGLFLLASYTTAKAIFVNFYDDQRFLAAVDKIFRSIDIIDKVKCPTLFIHGQQDKLINPSESEILFTKAKMDKKEIEFREIMDHNLFDWKEDVFDLMERFYYTHCGDLLTNTEEDFEVNLDKDYYVIPDCLKEKEEQHEVNISLDLSKD